MALIVKMKEGNTVPLYTFYGKQYDFNELLRLADAGYGSYLSKLKRGSRNELDFRNALSDLIAGIGDGTVTYNNGKFVDSKGRYHNEKRRSKDYYGLAANYLHGVLSNMEEYKVPSNENTLEELNEASFNKEFLRQLFNSDTYNYQNFVDLDDINSETNKRGSLNRINFLKDQITKFKERFENGEFSKKYKNANEYYSKLKSYIDSAQNSLNDGLLNSDFMSLSRAFGGINWRKMFSLDGLSNPAQPKTPAIDTTKPTQEGFLKWQEENYPLFTGNLHSPISLNNDSNYGNWTLSTIGRAMQKLSTPELTRIIRYSLLDPSYTFNSEPFIELAFPNLDGEFSNTFGVELALKTLKNRGELKSFGANNPNLYYIPGTRSKNNTALVYDTNSNSILNMKIHDIPYAQLLLVNEYKSLFEDFFTNPLFLKKKGGVLKALDGLEFQPKSKLSDAVSYDYKNLLRLRHLWNGSGFDLVSRDNLASTDENAPGNNQYDIELGSGKDIESSSKHKFFVNRLLTDSKLAELFARDYRKLQTVNKNVYLNWFNNDDSFNFNNFKSSDVKIWADGLSGTGHDIYRGRTYKYKDGNNTVYYEGIPTGYSVLKGDPYEDDETGAYVYNLIKDVTPLTPVTTSAENQTTGVQNTSAVTTGAQSVKDTNDTTDVVDDEESGEESDVYRRLEYGNTEANKWKKFANLLIPQGIALGRLMASQKANNRIAETVKKSLYPVLRDTYELYSPVTGAFGEKLFYNLQAENLRFESSEPYTSDASLNLARLLEGNRQALQLEEKGMLTDNNMIRKTLEEALKRSSDNMKRRSDVANFNRESINRTVREKAQLEASRKKFNWQSLDNYLKGTENKLTTSLKEDEDRRNNFRLQSRVSDLDRQYENAVLEYKPKIEALLKKNEGVDPNTLPEYVRYKKYLRDLRNWKNAQLYGIHANIYGYDYKNDYLPVTIDELKTKHKIFKQGGILKPSTRYMINKIIKNENNS